MPSCATLGIAHIDCDAFYASVEKRDDPTLEDRPLIVGHAGGRGVVTTACYLARISGVRSAMPMFQALELCPDAVVLPPDMAKYKRVSEAIRDIFLSATPLVEPVSLDEAYLDLTDEHRIIGADGGAGAGRDRAAGRERGRHHRVDRAVAPTSSWPSSPPSCSKPAGFSVIGRAEAKAFLATLSVRKIHGVGAATARRMEARGHPHHRRPAGAERAAARSALRPVRPAARALRARRGRAQRHAASAGEEHLVGDDVPARHRLGARS